MGKRPTIALIAWRGCTTFMVNEPQGGGELEQLRRRVAGLDIEVALLEAYQDALEAENEDLRQTIQGMLAESEQLVERLRRAEGG